MKCAVLKADSRVEVEERSRPEPGPDECLVRVEACGICSSDVARGFGMGAYHYPLVMGHELAGVVEEVGRSVGADLHVGQRVTVFPLLPCFSCPACQRRDYALCAGYDYYGSRRDGGYAEFLAVKGWNLLPLPDDVAIEDGALTEPMAVVLRALERLRLAGLPNRSRVAILGAGFLGMLGASIVRKTRPDLHVTVIDRNAEKLALARDIGAGTESLPDPADLDAFMRTESGHFHAVLEAAGAPETFAASLELAAPGAIVVWMGNISGDLDLGKSLVSGILRKELDIAGTWNSRYCGREPSDWTRALELMARGVRPSRLVNRRTTLESVSAVLEELAAHKSKRERSEILKALVTMSAGHSRNGVDRES